MPIATETREQKLLRLESIAKHGSKTSAPRYTRADVHRANFAATVAMSTSLLQRANISTHPEASVREQLGELSFADVCRESLALDGLRVPQNDADMIRAALSGAGSTFRDVCSAAVGTAVVEGFREQVDNASGLFTPMPMHNFRVQKTLVLDDSASLEWLPRGDTAEHADISVSSGAWFLSRYAKQVILSEQDMIDGRDSGGLVLIAVQLGAAAKRLQSDLFFSTLLSNPTLDADSKAMFHADHNNLATAALDSTSLALAIAGVGNQIKTTRGDRPIHLNIRPNVLLVPPDLDSAARTAVRAIKLDDLSIDIEVRSESRISAPGVIRPETDQLVQGSATNWFLASRSKVNPGFVLGHLGGNAGLLVRPFTLSRGQWGLVWDIHADVGIKCVGFESWHLSDGTT